MMVVFVSQCEKNAIKKTNRVLDAFANRIGDRTWQTAITQEGLSAIKKELRKTASKSTAISCHWVRSSKRTDVLWTIGRKNYFTNTGVVPVNYTKQDIGKFMDALINNTQFLANTKGQPLSQHLFSVGYLAAKLIEKMGVEERNLQQSCFIAGVLHDIGKLDPQFQAWLNKKINKVDEDYIPDDGVHIDGSVKGHANFSFEKHPRHNEISWLWAESLIKDDSSLNALQKQQLLHGVYWHHSKPYRKDDSYFNKAKGIDKLLEKSLTSMTMDKVYEQVIIVLKEVGELTKMFYNEEALSSWMPKWNFLYHLTDNELPSYKLFDDYLEEPSEYNENIKDNALNDLVRAAVISADRIVSAMSAEDLAEYLVEGTLESILDDLLLEETGLSQHIEDCLQGFIDNYPNSERNQEQSRTAEALAKLQEYAELDEVTNIGVLQGPAGCGKTKIALEWALKTHAKQIIWVCPRVQVCLGLLNDLTQAEYLPNAKIEILTGEYKKILTDGVSLDEASETSDDDYFSGDIVITTIDQVINNIISHSKVDTLVNFMQAHVVFDEFHELIPMSAFNLLFAELIEAKKRQKHNANTLLISATPHNYFVTELLKINKDYIVHAPSFNQSKYRIEFALYNDQEEGSPLIENSYTDGIKTFVITNTAQDAQVAFLTHNGNENNILLHSKYTKEDKVQWFNRVFDCFKRNGQGDFDVLRSGPIVQASLNISCDRMITELTNAENWLQRLGRLDRFGENNAVNVYTTIIPQSSESGKQTNSTAKFLNQLCSWKSTVAWLNFLKDQLDSRDSITLNELYCIYQAFYEDDNSKEKITKDIQAALKKSVNLINSKVTDPISFSPKSKQKDKVMKIAKSSLRGDNRFVQMAVCEVDENLKLKFIDEYAYDENTDLTKQIGLTESVDRITGYDDSDRNLLSYMKAKHHNIKDGAKKAYKDFVLLSEARSPEHPIYLSYTPKDLESVSGERERHKYAIYYVKTDKQPVGAMQIIKLTKPVKN